MAHKTTAAQLVWGRKLNRWVGSMQRRWNVYTAQ